MTYISPDRIKQFREIDERERRERFRSILAQLNAGERLTTKDRRWVCYYRKLAQLDATDEEIRDAIEKQIAEYMTTRLLG